MTDLEREVNPTRSNADVSRARQRKLKRDRQADVAVQAEADGQARESRRRTAGRNGPSIRERFAATHIKVPTPSMQSVQGKLSSRLGRIARQISEPPSPDKKAAHREGTNPRSPRRKSESRRSENLYEATARAETQRKSTPDLPYIPRKNRRLYDAHSGATPPVMVRGGMGGMAFGRVASSRLQKSKQPRRRYDVPLRVQGAEVRLPSMPFVHLGWRAVSLLMTLMMVASLFLVWKAPVFQVQSVEAEGLKRLTASDLNAVMTTFGTSVFSLDPNALEDVLQLAFPEFSKVAVRVGLPASVKVVVTERVPLIAWTQDGSEVWLDAEGVSFPPRGNPENPLVRVEGHGMPPGLTSALQAGNLESLPPGTPQTAAINPSIRLTPQLVTSILSLGAKIPPDTMLVYDSDHGLGWNDPSGWEVYFGAEDQDMQMKLNIYQTLVEHLQNEGLQPELISVEYIHAPYYRMER